MENFTLTISGSSVVFNGTTFAVTDSTGVETTYAIPSATTAPTITEVDVKESDGSEVVTTPEAPVEAPVETAPAA